MARTRSISSIETEITKVSAELQKAQEKVDDLTQRLLELQEQKQSIETKQIMDAFREYYGAAGFFRIFWYLPIRTIHEFCF